MGESRVLDWLECLGWLGWLERLERLELFRHLRAAAVLSVALRSSNVSASYRAGHRYPQATDGNAAAPTTPFSPRPKDAELGARYGLEDKFVAGYIGTHGMAHVG